MWDKICLMLPTYRRTANHLPAFIQSAMDNGSAEKICFAFLVNEKDKESQDFIMAYSFGNFKFEMLLERSTTPHLAKYYNTLYAFTETRDEAGTVVSMVGDDMIFRTKDWDKRMLDLINAYKGMGVFYGNDDFIARERLCVNIFVTRQFVQATERAFMCEIFPAEMIDVVWYEVGRLTKTLHFDADNHIFHNHGCKAPDATYNRLQPFRKAAHDIGKAKAREVAREIANILIKKGVVGDSVC